MDKDPTPLDTHRGMAAQKATEERRERADVAADQDALRHRRAVDETRMLEHPAADWDELAVRAAHLIALYAETPDGRDPLRRRLIEAVLADIDRLRAPGGR